MCLTKSSHITSSTYASLKEKVCNKQSCGSAIYFDADPDPGFYLMRIRIRLFTLMQIRIQILACLKPIKCSNRLISHTFWLFICKLMRIRIQLHTLTRILITI
jgi:hypothetical protein